ncbi:hypothetical protein IQ287_30550 [Burkholderia sp. R-69927]|nr:hypothetical protein [Burkholderia sp. R-70006]MBK5065120.1 hypothetical protein [Burkholderia sp. R-70199]MBK5090294.1 hypothetical protein [Burkholderia sp. R-69927]MBK5124717.1 hypothetical protein [Burkholderia sp. R-69980]MBK5168967.1 hypothetical protein [Burkholderia sp. R-70211]MCI0150637.1 hypothetical protein [Paraburkholderia sediminicola]
MKTGNHRIKAENIETSLRILGEDDWEMKIEAAMLAGTHWANYALHRRGVTSDSEDIVHNSMLVVNMLRKYSLAEGELLGALTEIEELRPLYVRGDLPDGSRAAARALELLRLISALARRAP